VAKLWGGPPGPRGTPSSRSGPASAILGYDHIMKRARIAVFIVTTYASAQNATIKQLMLDMIHPASNDILLIVNRGEPRDDKDWAAIRRGAITLTESGNLLTQPDRARDQGDWIKDARLLVEIGAAAYK